MGRGTRIIDPEERFWEASDIDEFSCDVIVDCGGGILAPGFLDIQINGAFGVDFSNSETKQDEVRRVASGLAAHGVTSFCPTVVTSAPETYRRVLRELKPFDGVGREGASNLGAHLEGPFINPRKKGAHAEEFILAPRDGLRDVTRVYGDLEGVRIVTLAPELDGAVDAIRGLTARGIVVSMGHSAATVKEGDNGFVAGARLLTHLFNAMGAFHHRDPGLVGLLGRQSEFEELPSLPEMTPRMRTARPRGDHVFADFPPLNASPVSGRGVIPSREHIAAVDEAEGTQGAAAGAGTSRMVDIAHAGQPQCPPELTHHPAQFQAGHSRPFYSLIVDGVHCHPYSATIARATHPTGLVLVTDAIPALGLPIGRHKLGTMEVDIRYGGPLSAQPPLEVFPSDEPRSEAVDSNPSDSSPPPAKRRRTAETRKAVEGSGYKGLHAVLAGTETLAGAVVPMDKCIRNLFRFTRCTAVDALEAATLHPARLLGMERDRGTLEVGARADLVLLTDDLHPMQTYVGGELAWQSPECQQ